MKEVFTQKQLKIQTQKKNEQVKSATIALKNLIEMSEVKDLIKEICLGKRTVKNHGYGKKDYTLLITSNELIKRCDEDETVLDYFREDNYTVHHTDDEKIDVKKTGIYKELVEFFNLTAKGLIIIQNKLK